MIEVEKIIYVRSELEGITVSVNWVSLGKETSGTVE